MIRNLVAPTLQGKSYERGRTPFEVLVFDCAMDYDSAEGEPAMKKFIVAKFSTYGDATRYAHQLDTAPCRPHLIVLRA